MRNLTRDGCESSEPVVAFCDTCFEYLCGQHDSLVLFPDHVGGVGSNRVRMIHNPGFPQSDFINETPKFGPKNNLVFGLC